MPIQDPFDPDPRDRVNTPKPNVPVEALEFHSKAAVHWLQCHACLVDGLPVIGDVGLTLWFFSGTAILNGNTRALTSYNKDPGP